MILTMELITRAKAIILSPTTEWNVIAAEPNNVQALYLRYALPLAAASALAAFIGLALIGSFFGYRAAIGSAFFSAIVGFLFSMISIFVVAKLAAFLAPKFGGIADDGAAQKLIVYSNTAGWLASLFLVIPPLGFLALLGLYGIYIFWTGVGPMLGVPDDKKLIFVLALGATAIVLNMLIGLIIR